MQRSALNADVNCAICQAQGQEMVRCCRCHLRVHKGCYGLPLLEQPQEECIGWMCERCYFVVVRTDPLDEDLEPLIVSCQFCPRQDGPLKMYRYEFLEERCYWAHVTCVEYHSALKYAPGVDPNTKIALKQKVLVTKTEREFRGCISQTCSYCKTDRGFAIKCAGKNGLKDCKTSFHVGCCLAKSMKHFATVDYLLTEAASSARMYCQHHLAREINNLYRNNAALYLEKLNAAGFLMKKSMEGLVRECLQQEAEERKEVGNQDKVASGELSGVAQPSVISLSSGSEIDPSRFRRVGKKSSSKKVKNASRKQILKSIQKEPPKKRERKRLTIQDPPKTAKVEFASNGNHVQSSPSHPLKKRRFPKKILRKVSLDYSEAPSEREFIRGLEGDAESCAEEERSFSDSIFYMNTMRPNTLNVCSEQHPYIPVDCCGHLERFKELEKQVSSSFPDATYPLPPTAVELPSVVKQPA